MSIKSVVAVCGCLIDNGKVLLEWRNGIRDTLNNLWILPGGKVDVTDFKISDAVVREFKEKTGLDVFVMYEFPDFYRKVLRNKFTGNLVEVELHAFRIGCPGASEKFEDDEDNFVWFPLETPKDGDFTHYRTPYLAEDSEAFIEYVLELDKTWEMYPEEMQ